MTGAIYIDTPCTMTLPFSVKSVFQEEHIFSYICNNKLKGQFYYNKLGHI